MSISPPEVFAFSDGPPPFNFPTILLDFIVPLKFELLLRETSPPIVLQSKSALMLSATTISISPPDVTSETPLFSPKISASISPPDVLAFMLPLISLKVISPPEVVTSTSPFISLKTISPPDVIAFIFPLLEEIFISPPEVFMSLLPVELSMRISPLTRG